jgi:PAS domain S-box-containing protein
MLGGNPALQTRLERHIRERQGELLLVDDCASALEVALYRQPQLILCGDVVIEGEGHRLLQRTRNEPRLRNIPFTLVTTTGSTPPEHELFKFKAHGASAILSVSDDTATFWEDLEAALKQVRTEKALLRKQLLTDETDFLHNCHQLLGDASFSGETALTSQDDRFRTMVESSPDWFWEFDQNADFTYVSPRIRDLLGYEPEELIGQNAFDLMDPAEAERVRQHFDPIAKKYQPFANLVNTNLHKDGHEVVIESAGTPIFDEAGRFLGYRGIDRDITERKRALQALRQSEQRLRESQEIARLGYYSYRFADQGWECSDVIYEIFGLETGTPITVESWLGLVHPDHRDTMQSYLEQAVLQQQKPFNRSYKIIRPNDGETCWLHGRGQLAIDDNGQAVSMTGSIQDITQMKRAEEQLIVALREARAARKELDALFASVADALVVTDPEQKIILINDAAEQLLGKELSVIRHQPISTLISEQAFFDVMQALLQGQDTNPTIEFSLPTPGGDARVIQARMALVYNDENQVTELIAILRDITRERKADRMKSEFISIAAHELRTPLTAVLGYAELLEQEHSLGQFSAQQRQEYLNTILQKSEQLMNIVDDLLSLSRIEAGRPITLEKRPYQMVAELKRIITSHGLEAAGHAYSMEFPEQDVAVECDSNKLEQVMDNLLSNAAKYSRGGAVITICGVQQDDQFLVQVTDQGIGMSPEQAERMFDKFYRVNINEETVGGLGLGMSISKSIIENHGGQIWVESQLGVGTTVSFTLPL